MHALIPILILAAPHPARASRLAFFHAISRVRVGWTESQVLQTLGKPDEIEHTKGARAHDTWSYGPPPPDPTSLLGTIFIVNNKVDAIIGADGQPPATSLISDAVLNKHLLVLWSTNLLSPLSSLTAVNDLIPLGRDKAFAVVQEFARVTKSDAIWRDWLVQVMCKPRGLAVTPSPEYFFEIVDDLPLCQPLESSPADAVNLAEFLKQNKSNMSLRSAPLVPPDDPFPAIQKFFIDTHRPFSVTLPYNYAVQTAVDMMWSVFDPQDIHYSKEGLVATGIGRRSATFVAMARFSSSGHAKPRPVRLRRCLRFRFGASRHTAINAGK